MFRFLTLGFGWIWLCHNDIAISEIVNNIKEGVKLLSPQRQVGAGASAGGEWLENKGPGSSHPLGELTPLVNDLDADASSGRWLEVEWRGEERICLPGPILWRSHS